MCGLSAALQDQMFRSTWKNGGMNTSSPCTTISQGWNTDKYKDALKFGIIAPLSEVLLTSHFLWVAKALHKYFKSWCNCYHCKSIPGPGQAQEKAASFYLKFGTQILDYRQWVWRNAYMYCSQTFVVLTRWFVYSFAIYDKMANWESSVLFQAIFSILPSI